MTRYKAPLVICSIQREQRCTRRLMDYPKGADRRTKNVKVVRNSLHLALFCQAHSTYLIQSDRYYSYSKQYLLILGDISGEACTLQSGGESMCTIVWCCLKIPSYIYCICALSCTIRSEFLEEFPEIQHVEIYKASLFWVVFMRNCNLKFNFFHFFLN